MSPEDAREHAVILMLDHARDVASAEIYARLGDDLGADVVVSKADADAISELISTANISVSFPDAPGGDLSPEDARADDRPLMTPAEMSDYLDTPAEPPTELSRLTDVIYEAGPCPIDYHEARVRAEAVARYLADRPSVAVETPEPASGTPGHPQSVMDWLDDTYALWWEQPLDDMPMGLRAAAWERRPGVIATDRPSGVPGFSHEYTVTFDGDTHWLEHDFCEGPVTPVEAGDSLEQLLLKVAKHNRTCDAPANSPTGDPTPDA